MGRHAAGLDRCFLIAAPIVIGSQQRPVAVTQFQGRVGQISRHRQRRTDGAHDDFFGLRPGHNETADEHVVARFDRDPGRDVAQAVLGNGVGR